LECNAQAPVQVRNPFAIRSYEKYVRKPFGMCTYKFIGLKVPWNEQLQKRVGVPPSKGPSKAQ